MKLNKLFLLLLALPLAFAACEPVEPLGPQPDPVLTLTSESSMHFTPEGGQGTITYTIENPGIIELTAVATTEWVTNITIDNGITFTVEPNPTTEERRDRILVTYGEQNFNVFIIQEGIEPVVTFEAEKFEAVYYGTQYSPNYNVAIYLSDLGFTEDGYALPGGIYYTLDLYMDQQPPITEDGWMTVPAGTYTYDGTDSYKDMSIGVAYSSYFKINEDGSAYEEQASYESVELTITESNISFVAYIDGVKHVVSYNGAPVFFAGVPVVLEDTEVEAITLVGEYYADKYSTSFCYYVQLSDKGYSEDGDVLADAHYFAIDLYGVEPTIDTEGYLHIPAGTYTYDVNDDLNYWEIGREYSGGYKVNAALTEYEWIESFEDATVTVTENSLVLSAQIAGATYTVTYNDEPKFLVGASTYAAKAKTSFAPAKQIAKF